MKLMLRKLRKTHDMTQSELAERIGTTLRVVSSWEREETVMPLIDAARIADVFECTLDELAGREWPPAGYTSDETKLVDAYRECTPREQHSLLDMAQTMADDGQAKNHPASSEEDIA